MDHAYARVEGVEGTREAGFLPVQEDGSLEASRFGYDGHAEEDLHEGGLARAVLADEAEDLAFTQIEIDVLEHHVPVELLGHILQ